jgi:hypothetical protein
VKVIGIEYNILVRRPEGIPRCRWEDNIKIDEVVD